MADGNMVVTVLEGKLDGEAILAELRAIRRLLEGPPPVQRQPNVIDEFLMAGRTLGQGIKTAGQ